MSLQLQNPQQKIDQIVQFIQQTFQENNKGASKKVQRSQAFPSSIYILSIGNDPIQSSILYT